MHLQDGLLDPITTILLWLITVSFMVLGYFRMGKIFQNEDSDKLIPYIGVLGAVIFAFQFVNYPIPGGTSGHLVGGTLVAVILGPWASVIVLFLILVIQSLFGDGGITALGPNAFNMGIIGGVLGFYLVKLIILMMRKTSLKKENKVTIATAIGSYIAILLASIACGFQLAIAGTIPLQVAVPALFYWHVFIGLGEGVISALIVFYIYKAKPEFITTEIKLGVLPNGV
jgi:cobalt/nickel transport system permease protein